MRTSSFKFALVPSLIAAALAGGALAQPGGISVSLDPAAGGSTVLITSLRSDVEVFIQDTFLQSSELLSAARRTAAVIQIMSTNENVTKEEAKKHMFLHMATTYCMRKEIRGSNDLKDSLTRKLKDTVLNTAARRENYGRYQEVIKGMELAIPTDDDCIRLTQKPI